jgi:hypothetical protein
MVSEKELECIRKQERKERKGGKRGERSKKIERKKKDVEKSL